MITLLNRYVTLSVPSLEPYQGMALIANVGDQTVLSYRIPSRSQIEFRLPDEVQLPALLTIMADDKMQIFKGYICETGFLQFPVSKLDSRCTTPLQRESLFLRT